MKEKRLKLLEHVLFEGHHNLLATNSSTLEITKEDFLTLRGDCIIGIRASKSCAQLSEEAKSWLQGEGNPVLISIEVGGNSFDLLARGSSRLTHTSNISIVIRKSDYTCHRTLAVKASASAKDLPRDMVAALKEGAEGSMNIYALH